MNFFTKVDILPADFKIDYKSNLFFIGSCLADNISDKWKTRKFQTLVNPFGTVYNPLSIENQIVKLCDEQSQSWSRWDYQGTRNGEDVNETAAKSRAFLQKADVVFITLGTAFVYFLKESGKAVANCHKEPAELFERRLISVEEAAEALRNICRWILHCVQNDNVMNRKNDDGTCRKNSNAMNRENVNADADLRQHNVGGGVRIVFTISPIRHLNDGAHGNNLSKATLQLAVEKVCKEFANKEANSVSYFPSYEIVMDELRDYRFYAEDMTHVNATAEEYIFERMVETYCDTSTIANMKQVEKFMKTASHRIEDASSPRTVELAKQQIEKAQELEKQIAGLSLSEEIAEYSKYL